MCGIGGFGSMQLFIPKLKVHECIDFHGKAPETATPDMWSDRIEGEARDGFGFILKDHINDIGYQSITAPGSLKAYYEAHRDYGVLDWKTILQPAIEYAENGWVVRPHVDFGGQSKTIWSHQIQIGLNSQVWKGSLLWCTGNLKAVGDKVVNNDLADTLKRIAKMEQTYFTMVP